MGKLALIAKKWMDALCNYHISMLTLFMLDPTGFLKKEARFLKSKSIANCDDKEGKIIRNFDF